MLPKVIRQEDFLPFTETLFDREEQARKAAPILKGILDAGSPRLSDISHKMPGSPDAGYKAIQRFLAEVDPREHMEKIIALVLLAYAIGLLVGEALGERLYRGKNQKLYSGLFILLRHRVKLRREEMVGLLRRVWDFFRRLAHGSVRIQV